MKWYIANSFHNLFILNYNDKPYVFLIVAISYSFDLSLEYINTENKEPNKTSLRLSWQYSGFQHLFLLKVGFVLKNLNCGVETRTHNLFTQLTRYNLWIFKQSQ